MERIFLECTVRAALLVVGAAIVLLAMRVKPAAAKHRVWSGVMALMLLLPIWAAWGPKVSLRLLPPLAPAATNQSMPLATTLPGAPSPSPFLSTGQAVLLGVYLSGVCLLLFRLGIGTVRARKLFRDAVAHDSIRTSSLCAAPVTVGFFRPVVILPEHWQQWPQSQLEIVLTHEGAHAQRCDSLVQWLALLNRALYWFHPAAWWLESKLSALAEESCDSIVLARGYDAGEYAEYLIDMARSVTRSGTRVNVAGMAMPGSFLPKRIRRIMAGNPTPRISRTRMACVAVACAITCTAFAAGRLDHAKSNLSGPRTMSSGGSESTARPAAKFVLGDLTIQGDVHDRDAVRDRILKGWNDREFDAVQELLDSVVQEGIRADLQERGYFKVVVQDPVSKPLTLTDGKQRILVIATVAEGPQFRLGTITIENADADRALSIPAATLRERFHISDGGLFNMTEIRAGLERMMAVYKDRGFPDAAPQPEIQPDDVTHRISLILRITEGPHKP
jgi:beta-lactamase regulating signal transducer with metallopeptidase domain